MRYTINMRYKLWLLLLAAPRCFGWGDIPPDWISKPSRSVDSGYIVYVGVGEATTEERARLLAEGAAIEDLANECTFPPKGARIEDRYDQPGDNTFKSFAKVSVTFDDCDHAQKAITPEEMRPLANIALVQELKQYQDDLASPSEPAQVGSEPAPPPSNVTLWPAPRPWGTSPPAWKAYAVNDEPSYFLVRQQVAYSKLVVLLAAPNIYYPRAAITTEYLAHVRSANVRLADYARANPGLRTSEVSWSKVRNSPPPTATIAEKSEAPAPPPSRKPAAVAKAQAKPSPKKKAQAKKPTGKPKANKKKPAKKPKPSKKPAKKKKED